MLTKAAFICLKNKHSYLFKITVLYFNIFENVYYYDVLSNCTTFKKDKRILKTIIIVFTKILRSKTDFYHR